MAYSYVLLLLVCYVTYEPVSSMCPVTSLPDGWTMINVPGSDFCYALSDDKVNQQSARQNCWNTFRGYLARFHDLYSLQNLARKIQINTKRIWIDLVSRTQGATRKWAWSDGFQVAGPVLSAKWNGISEPEGEGALCGALTDSPKMKFSKWTEVLCAANNEYICQAPKVKEASESCPNSSFHLNDNCYSMTSQASSFQDSLSECKLKFNGHLAPLESRELAAATANYLDFGQTDVSAKTIRVWLDIVWNSESKVWEHENGRKVTTYEENWNDAKERGLGDNKSSVVMDQSVQWRWKARQPEWKAFALCEVDSLDTIEGKALPLPTKNKTRPGKGGSTKAGGTKGMGPPTTTTAAGTALKLIVDFKILIIIVGAVAIVLLIVLVVVCILCCKKGVCCLHERKSENKPQNDGFGTPVSFSFMNPEYDNNLEAVSAEPRPPGDTLTSEPRLLPDPPESDEMYATINDNNMSPPASTLDLLNAPVSLYSTLSVATTLPRSGGIANGSTSSLTRSNYKSRLSVNNATSQASISSRDPVPTPFHGRQMTSFHSPASHVPDFPRSPRYAEMNKKIPSQDTSKEESSTTLQYAELTFGRKDEDDQFVVDGKTDNESCYVENGSLVRERFQENYPSITGVSSQRQNRDRNEYENEHSPLIVSPDSPQFPF